MHDLQTGLLCADLGDGLLIAVEELLCRLIPRLPTDVGVAELEECHVISRGRSRRYVAGEGRELAVGDPVLTDIGVKKARPLGRRGAFDFFDSQRHASLCGQIADAFQNIPPDGLMRKVDARLRNCFEIRPDLIDGHGDRLLTLLLAACQTHCEQRTCDEASEHASDTPTLIRRVTATAGPPPWPPGACASRRPVPGCRQRWRMRARTS